ncbi:thermonuclease family protein [Desulfovirgula thermocuniculi]|uniref:thermonuclease family protein n=1 Tax=Desulfovirgula thermocuniculi TaxID=348842 RepID=UPI0006853082|nr:thermonuclease family protein [Desulfovirgula thermocuniculi]
MNNLARLRFAALIIFLAFALALLAGCAGGGPPQAAPQKDRTAQDQPAAQAPVQTQQPPGTPTQAGIRTVQATVISVSDGDTVHVNFNGRDERVRMIGVNCPEISHPDLGIKEEPYGREAKAHTERQLSDRQVWLEFDVQERDNYGRLLAYVWLEPPSSGSEDEVRAKMYNARLLLDGYAQVMTVPPNVKYANLFAKFQREAREAGKGLWGLSPDPATGDAGKQASGTQ